VAGLSTQNCRRAAESVLAGTRSRKVASFGTSDTGSDLLWKRCRTAKIGDATGQASLKSLRRCYSEIFLWKTEGGRKKRKRSKKERSGGVWKLTPPIEIRNTSDFDRGLKSASQESSRFFHSSHRPHSQDQFTIGFGQRSALGGFCV